jgi:heme exporter protein A
MDLALEIRDGRKPDPLDAPITVMSVTLSVTSLSLKKGYNLLIHDLSFKVAAGDAISLTGENGVGKTTLLRTLAGFLSPHKGLIEISKNAVLQETSEAQTQMFHYLGHSESLSPTRTAAQELAFQMAWLGGTDVALDAAIKRLRLESLLDLETRYLSAGQKRRLSLARLLFAHRPIWCLDEPMAPLDADHRALLADLMQAHVASGGLLICAVHDPLPFVTRALHLTRPALSAQEAEIV